MSAPIAKKLDVTSSENTHLMGVGIREVHIKNQGVTDCQIEFDGAVSTDSYLLEAGETLSVEHPVIRLHFKTASGTTTLYVLKLTQ